MVVCRHCASGNGLVGSKSASRHTGRALFDSGNQDKALASLVVTGVTAAKFQWLGKPDGTGTCWPAVGAIAAEEVVQDTCVRPSLPSRSPCDIVIELGKKDSPGIVLWCKQTTSPHLAASPLTTEDSLRLRRSRRAAPTVGSQVCVLGGLVSVS